MEQTVAPHNEDWLIEAPRALTTQVAPHGGFKESIADVQVC